MKDALVALLCLLLCSLPLCGQQAALPQDYTEPPQLRWTYQTNGPIFSTPVRDGELLYVASTDSTLYALDIQTGLPRHRFRTGGDIRSQIRLHGSLLALVSGDGKLYLLNKKDLSLRWSFASRGDKKYSPYSFADYFQSSPLFHEGRIYFGSGDGFFYAVDLETGQLAWEYQTGDVVHADPALYRDKICFGSFDGYFYAIDARHGTLVWKFKSVGQRYFPRGEMTGAALVFDNMVYAAGRDYNFYALDAESGHGVWNRQFPSGWALAPPVVHNGALYVGTSDDKALFALDPHTGRELWKAGVGFNVFGAPAFSGSMVYVCTLMGRLYALDKASGEVLWAMDSDRYKAHRQHYFTETDAYRPDIQKIVTGDDGFLKMYYALGALFAGPLIAEDLLVLASTDGKVYAYTRQ